MLNAENEKLRQLEKKSLFKMLTKNLMTEFYVREFVNKFRRKYQEKLEMRQKKLQDKLNQEILVINEAERVDLEEEAMRLEVLVSYNSKPCPSPGHINNLLNIM